MPDLFDMKIYLNEIGEREKNLVFDEEKPWVLQSVKRVDEDVSSYSSYDLGPEVRDILKKRVIRAKFVLRKIDDVYEVSGEAESPVILICSRCANPFKRDYSPHFHLLFTPDPDVAGSAHLDEGKVVGGGTFGRQNQTPMAEKVDLNATSDFDITHVSEDFIDLGEVLTEQIRLQIPLQPLCQDSCKGVCANCGADLNQGRCACDQKLKSSPFKGLLKEKANVATKEKGIKKSTG